MERDEFEYRTMTDDDASELAEALATACDEWIAGGGHIGALLSGDCRCPFGALHPEGPRHPGPSEASAATGLSRDDVSAFMQGFDAAVILHYDWIHPLRVLGHQFRDRYITND